MIYTDYINFKISFVQNPRSDGSDIILPYSTQDL
jgi:hypothetical protein